MHFLDSLKYKFLVKTNSYIIHFSLLIGEKRGLIEA